MNGWAALVSKVILGLFAAAITGSVAKTCGDVESNTKTLILIDERARSQSQMTEWNALKLDRVLSKLGVEAPAKPPLPESAIRGG